jgi:predicted transcriptional regulator
MLDRTTTRLDKHVNTLMEVLGRKPGEWVTRSDIAKALEKRRLSSYDIAMLEILHNKGMIEIELRDNRTPIGYEFVYRTSQPT